MGKKMKKNGQEYACIVKLLGYTHTTLIIILKLHLMKIPKENKGCVSHCGLAIYMKTYLKAKEELWKLKYFTMQKKNKKPYLQKNPLKRNQNPSRYYYNSIITNLKIQHKPKISSFKNPHITNNILKSWHLEVY